MSCLKYENYDTHKLPVLRINLTVFRIKHLFLCAYVRDTEGADSRSGAQAGRGKCPGEWQHCSHYIKCFCERHTGLLESFIKICSDKLQHFRRFIKYACSGSTAVVLSNMLVSGSIAIDPSNNLANDSTAIA